LLVPGREFSHDLLLLHALALNYSVHAKFVTSLLRGKELGSGVLGSVCADLGCAGFGVCWVWCVLSLGVLGLVCAELGCAGFGCAGLKHSGLTETSILKKSSALTFTQKPNDEDSSC
jgi:hypothetical protein